MLKLRLNDGIMAQAVRVVGVFVAGGNLKDALPEKGFGSVLHVARIAGVGQHHKSHGLSFLV